MNDENNDSNLSSGVGCLVFVLLAGLIGYIFLGNEVDVNDKKEVRKYLLKNTFKADEGKVNVVLSFYKDGSGKLEGYHNGQYVSSSTFTYDIERVDDNGERKIETTINDMRGMTLEGSGKINCRYKGEWYFFRAWKDNPVNKALDKENNNSSKKANKVSKPNNESKEDQVKNKLKEDQVNHEEETKEKNTSLNRSKLKPTKSTQELLSYRSPEELISNLGLDKKDYRIQNVYRRFDNKKEGKKIIIFPATKNEVIVEFEYKDTGKKELKPSHINISHLAPKWKIPHNIRVGMSLNQLIKENGGKNIKIYGFETDMGGMVGSWNNGKLANKNISVTLQPDPDSEVYNSNKYFKVTGGQKFSSSNEVIQKLNLQVESITIMPN